MSEKLWFLKQCQLFERLAPAELAAIESQSRSCRFRRKTPIYLPAEDSNSVFLLAEGRAKICHITAEGKQSILAFIEPGEIFGELAMFSDGPRDEYAEAVEASTIVMIPSPVVTGLMEQYSDLSMGITKMIGLRRQRIERRLKNLLFLSNRERLTHLLLELAEQYGRRTPDGIQLTIKLAHQDLANIIGSTRETVTVTLGEMQADGLIAVGRRKILIRDLQRLSGSIQPRAAEAPRAISSNNV